MDTRSPRWQCSPVTGPAVVAAAAAATSTVAKPPPAPAQAVAATTSVTNTTKLIAPKSAPPVGNPAAMAPLQTPPTIKPAPGVAAAPPSLAAKSSCPSPSLREGQEPETAHGGGGANARQGSAEAPGGTVSSESGGSGGAKNRGEENQATVNAVAGDGTPGVRVGEPGTGGVRAAEVSAGPAEAVVMDAEAQRRATCLALYQVGDLKATCRGV